MADANFELLKDAIEKFSPQYIANVERQRRLYGLTKQVEITEASTMSIPIFDIDRGGGTVHVPGQRIPQISSSIGRVMLEMRSYDHSMMLDKVMLSQRNYDYYTCATNDLLPSVVSKTLDQDVMNAWGDAPWVPEIDQGDILEQLEMAQITLDTQENPVPDTERYLVLPMEAKKLLYDNERAANNLWVSTQVNSIQSGKVGELFGFKTVFMPNYKQGGLIREYLSETESLVHAYAVQRSATYTALGYGGNRSSDGTGGIVEISDEKAYGSLFVNMPVTCGSKVVLNKGIVRIKIKVTNAPRSARPINVV